MREAARERVEIEHQLNVLAQEDRSKGLESIFDDMVKRAQDAVGAIKDTFTEAITGINDQLVNLMTGKRTNFGNMFSGVASSVAKSGLGMAEGKLLGTFHLGKRDGSSPQSALYTISAEDVKKTGTDVLGLAKGSPDPSTGNQTGGLFGQAANSIWGSILGAFIPRQTGGPVTPGRAYLVGERGPEPFFPGVSGTMATNAAMRGAFGGGGTTIHMPIDARGSNDPAAVNAAIHRAMRSYMPMMVGASAVFQQDLKRRLPPSSPHMV